MRIFRILLMLLFVMLSSCDDDISYFSEFEEEAILYCIIDADSETQNVIITRSYNDRKSDIDHIIKNANVSLSSQYKSVTLEPFEESELLYPKYYYRTDNFKPIGGSELSINAVLEDGRELKSNLTLPRFSLFYFDQTELAIPLDELSSNYLISWNTNDITENIAFLSYLYIDYSIQTLEGEVEKRIEIPVEYQLEDNESVPVYPSVTENYFQSYKHSAVDYALKKISEGDTNKTNYKIIGGALEIFVLEENLATYYASTKTFEETFTVKVFETIISNIEGGKGVFGAYLKKTLPVTISKSYIRNLGYSY